MANSKRRKRLFAVCLQLLYSDLQSVQKWRVILSVFAALNSKVKSAYISQVSHQAGACPGFSSKKQLARVVLLLPLDGLLVHRRVTPSIKSTGTHLYTWVERGTVRVKCLAKNTTQCTRSGLEHGPLAPESSALTMKPPGLARWRVQTFFSFCVIRRIAPGACN